MYRYVHNFWTEAIGATTDILGARAGRCTGDSDRLRLRNLKFKLVYRLRDGYFVHEVDFFLLFIFSDLTPDTYPFYPVD